jgi:alkylated DNA repair dioxygenase AlkB
MFSGTQDTNINDPLPELFEPFYNFMKNSDNRYNQVIANWYQDKDYIPLHSDCDAKMVNNYTIGLINLNIDNDDSDCRYFQLISKEDGKEFNIALRHGIIITMGGDCQQKFTHSVLSNGHTKKRMSLSFRQF